MSADPIIYCLEHLTDYRQFERLCSDMMAGVGYTNLDPFGGTGDRGRDALHKSGANNALTIFAYSVRTDWRNKLQQDCKRIHDEGHGPSRMVFVCTSSLSASEKDFSIAQVATIYGWDLEIYDLERIRVLLAGSQRHLVAQHPAIFCPPWFPQRGGLSISDSADTLIIDHIVQDHALATWLARRLALEGFRCWCHGTAPLAGENADESVRTLIQRRAIQYLPILSPHSLSDRELMDRCAAAGAHDDLVLPCWAAPLEDVLDSPWLKRLQPARFDSSWSRGLRDAQDRLKAKGISPSLEGDRGRSIALRAYVPEPVTSSAPERVFANVFSASVPTSLKACGLTRSLELAEMARLRERWAFCIASPKLLLSFEPPPADLPLVASDHVAAYAWEAYPYRHGKRSIDVVKELVRRSLDVACVKAGLRWCPNREVFYFPQIDGKQTNLSFRHVDGRNTHVAANGERQYGWGERASKFHYQLAPRFRASRDEEGSWWVTTRLYVRVTDTSGTPFELKDITRRRKSVTKSWWNKEWIARLLGVMQALRTSDSDIQIGEGQHAVTVSAVPLEWSCPVSIDVIALDRIGDVQEEMAAIRSADDSDDSDKEYEANG